MGLALLQPQPSLLQRRLSFQAVATRFSKLQTRALLRRYKTRTTLSSLFLQTRPNELKMATPETFSETGSETMYEKV